MSSRKPTKEDIRKAGISPLTGLKSPITFDPEEAKRTANLESQYATSLGQLRKSQSGIDIGSVAPISGLGESVPYENGSVGAEFGKSKYDTGNMITPVNSFDELQQRRYDEQPWYDVAANGIAKATGRALTSFITGVIGSVAGLGTMAYHGFKYGEWNPADLFDNPLSNALSDLDEWADKTFTNYKSVVQQQNEQNGEWYKNLTGLNMIMDDIVTNFGFIVGMGAAAAVTGGVGGAIAGGARRAAAGALRAARRSGNMAQLWGATKAAGIVQKYGRPTAEALTLINSSAGEAALEGLGVKREMMNEETDRINSTIDQHIAQDQNIQALDAEYQSQMNELDMMYMHNPNDPEYLRQKEALTAEYGKHRSQLSEQWEQRRQAALQELDESSDRAGTATALLNMAILIPSNFNMYGRLINKSFRNAEKSAGHSWAVRGGEIHSRNALNQQNIIGSIKDKSWNEIRGNAKNYGSRTFLGNTAKRMASTAFSEGVYEEMGQSAASTGAKAYHEWDNPDNYWRARLDPDSIDKFADGSHDFLSALGQGLSETYGSIEGWRDGFIGAVSGMAWGAGEARDEWRDTRYARRSAKELNRQLQSDRLPNLLQHMIAQSYHDNIKEGYARMNDQGSWKTEDDKQVYALVSAFDRAGRMDDLQHLINSYAEQMSDEDIENMINSATRTVTSQEQINQMKQEIRKNTAQKVEAHLKDGVSMDDYMRSVDEVAAKEDAMNQADAAVKSARQKAADDLGDNSWLNKPISELRTIARRGRDRQKRAAAKSIVDAFNSYQVALNDARYARYQQGTMYASNDSEANIQSALEEYDRLNEAADNSAPEEYLEGPFVSANSSNVMSKDEVRDTLKHNTERIQQVVKRYQDAIERVNRDTRGVLSKDQEDYLAYAQFMAESSGFRAQEMVQKWRDILPEVLTIRHKNKSTAAKFAGVRESDVEEDPENEGVFRINTKGMTDNQFATFVLHGLLRQSHVNDKNDTGDGSQTANLRKSLAEEALDAIEREHTRTGRRDTFDRDELQRDFEAIDEYFKKNQEYAQAYMDALSNPESIMTAKDKALRYLKRKYNQAKTKLRQKQMSVQQLGDLSDDELKSLDAYHFALAKGEKIRRRVKAYLDSRMPDIYSRIEQAFADIKDEDTRNELIQRVKDAVNDYIARFTNPETIDADDAVDPNAISAMFDLDEIVDKNSDLWKNLGKDTQDAVQKAFDKLKGTSRLFSAIMGNVANIIRSVGNALDKLRSAAASFAKKLNSSSTVEQIKDTVSQLLHKGLSDEQIDSLTDCADVIRDKISKISDAAKPGYKAVVGVLNSLLKRIEKYLSEHKGRRQPYTDPVSSPQPDSANGTPTNTKQPQQATPDIAGRPSTEHLQNPSIAFEEPSVQAHMEIVTGPMATTDIWQSTTGEFARRSNFTYQPYHLIVEEELKKYEDKADDTQITIPMFGDKGGVHTKKEWQDYAKRSRIVWQKLHDSGAFSYIDSGKVTSSSPVGFRMVNEDGIFIVYITHNGNIIGDLNDPAFGAEDTTGLAELYAKLKEEYGNSTGEVDSKYTTTVANVYAGFMRYSGKENGEVKTRSVASFGEDANDVTFFIAGVTDPSQDQRDIIGHGRSGQPFILVPAPSNGGLDRRHAVPVKTNVMTRDGLEMKVIKAALNSGLSVQAIRSFLNHFLNCKSVFIKENEADQSFKDLGLSDKAEATTEIHVVTRDVSNGKEVEAVIRIAKGSGEVLITNGNTLRANVSFGLLNGIHGVSYEQVAKADDSLPETYTDFLKQICQIPLEDLKVHNSWITLNKLEFNDDGSTSVVKDPVQKHNTFTETGETSIMVRDPYLGESYRITLTRNQSDGSIGIVRIEVSKNKQPFVMDKVSEATKARLLPVLAEAVLRVDGYQASSTHKFVVNGIMYEFTPTSKSSVGKVTVSADTLEGTQLDNALFSALRSFAGSFNGVEWHLNDIINKWFIPGTIKQGSAHYNALRDMLLAVKDKKRKFGGIPKRVKIDILNSRKPLTKKQEEGRKITQLLVNRIRLTAGSSLMVITDQAEGQRILDEWRKGKHKDLQPFMKDGQTVYGFAYQGKIYLDPDIMQPETFIHEYTHLWTNILRSSKKHKPIWDKLVAELKKMPEWDDIKKVYSYLSSDDEIADEVFARISGQNGEQWLRRKLAEETKKSKSLESSFDAMISKLKDLAQQLIDYIKNNLLGINTEAKTLSDALQELIWNDMLSDNPLDSFDNLPTVAEEQTVEPEPEHEVPSGKYRVSDYINTDGFDVQQILDDWNITVDEDGMFELPEGTTLEDFNLVKKDIQPHINTTGVEIADVSPVSSEDIAPSSDADVVSNLNRVRANGVFGYPVEVSSMQFVGRLEQGITRNRHSVDDMVTAANILLTEEQRNTLWNHMSDYMVTRGLHRYQIVAHLSALYNRYLSNGTVGDEVFDNIFSKLSSGIQDLVKNRSAVFNASSQPINRFPETNDVLSMLSGDELRLAHSESLNLLSSQDEEYLKMAGHSKAVYMALSDEAKEKIRRCVL